MANTADLIAQVVAALEPGSFCTRFVLVAEVIGTDGERGVWINTAEDARRSDVYGLLMEALTREQAKHTRDVLDEPDD